MIISIPGLHIVVMAALVYLFLLYKTNRLMASISTTTVLATMVASYGLIIIKMDLLALVLILFVMSLGVWRLIPHNNIDSWEKNSKI